MPFYMYYDATYILVLIGFAICTLASAGVNSAMRKYASIGNSFGMSGEEAALRILHNEGLYNVQVECLHGSDGDHYDPRTNTVRLSYENFNSRTITAVSVAAHECGHAIQHAKGYAPLSIRSAIVPVVNIGSRLGVPLIFLGVILSWNQVLIQVGLWCFALAVLFQLITLPVEFNASRRALEKLESYNMVTVDEKQGCRKVLTAAAMTYVAATLSSALQLLRLVLLYGNRSDRRRR